MTPEFANQIQKRFPRLNHETQWLATRPIAHRGLHSNRTNRPENSLAAFEAAAAAGIPIELDVQISADDKLFVIHDEDLERLTGQPGMIWNFSSEELSGLTILGTNQKIPQLYEVFECVNGRVPILIEIKNVRNKRRINELTLEAIRTYNGPVAITSFNVFSVSWFRRHAPSVARGVLVANFRDIKVVGLLKRFLLHIVLRHSLIVWIAHPHFVIYKIEMLPCIASKITHWRKKPVLSWTIRTKSQHHHAKLFSDNYIFEKF